MSGRDANLIVSVRSPVGTGVPKTGQRITISDITFEPSGSGHERKKAPAVDGQGKLKQSGVVVRSTLSTLHHCRAERFLVAQTTAWDLFISAKDLFDGANMVLRKPSSLLIEHDGFIHFEERPLDRRLRQSVPLQYLIIQSHQHFELCERCLPKVLV